MNQSERCYRTHKSGYTQLDPLCKKTMAAFPASSTMKSLLLLVALLLARSISPTQGFAPIASSEHFAATRSLLCHSKTSHVLRSLQKLKFTYLQVEPTPSGSKDEDSDVAVGSEEYYKGFLSRSLNDESEDRVSGQALLGPTFKLVGGFAVVIGALLLGFLASNGLL